MNYFFFLAIVLFVYVSFWFVLSLIKKRNDLADLAWGLGFVLLALVSFYINYQSYGLSLRSGLVTGMITLWGVRLALHIYFRNRGKGEDYRYKKWREEWKYFKIRSYFQVFLLQGFLLFLISLPVLIINQAPASSLQIIDFIGFSIWIIGFSFEVIGDYQLKKFIEDPDKEGVMQSGLWKFSRHPNYFGEVAQWWGVWIVSISATANIFGVLGPITISFLILKVSGIPLLEERMSRKPGFDEYKRKTSKFFPLPPKK